MVERQIDNNAAPDAIAANTELRHTQEADLEAALNAAMASQRYLVAVWHVSDGQVHLFRESGGFPLTDLSAAETLLRDDFAILQSSI